MQPDQPLSPYDRGMSDALSGNPHHTGEEWTADSRWEYTRGYQKGLESLAWPEHFSPTNWDYAQDAAAGKDV